MSDVEYVRIESGAPVREPIALLIAVVGGAVAATADAAPTGGESIDGVVVFAAAVAVIWAAASSPWWVLAFGSIIAAAVSFDPLLIAAATLAFVASLVSARRPGAPIEVSGVIAAVLVNVLIRSDLGGAFGAATAIGVLTCATIAVAGLARRRRRVWIGALVGFGVAALAMLLASALAGLAAFESRQDLADGADETQRAVDALSDGDVDAASAAFRDAADMFGRAADRFAGATVAPSRFVPIVAQHASVLRELSSSAEMATSEAAEALATVDLDALTLDRGRIDIDAVRAVAEPLRRVQEAVVRLEEDADAVRSPWLLLPIEERIDDLVEEIDENEPRLDLAVEAATAAPGLLGGDESRRYLVLFTTPAEARGLGGFTGNYAEVTIDDGRIDVTDFGRSGDINEQLVAARATCDRCPGEVLDHYGAYGFATGSRGRVDPEVWLNLTMPAHFPHVAATAAELYEQATDRPIDGVIVVDPYVLAELMRFTGPIDVPSFDRSVSADDVVEFLLVDQYVLADENEERVDALDTLGRRAIVRFLNTTLPEPAELIDRFGPLVAERRLLVWSTGDEEQAVLDELGLLGALPALGAGEPGFAFAVTNAGGSKIDSFLDRSVTAGLECDDGARRLVADVVLRNGAPASGLPEYVIGNEIGLPVGTSRLIVAFYGPSSGANVALDGSGVAVGSFREAGWYGHRHVVDLGPGDEARYRVEYDVVDGSCDDDLVSWEQPLRR